MRVLGTLETAHCKDLLSVVREWNTRRSALWHRGDLWGPMQLFELDIKAMFPSLNRKDVWDAFNTITDCVVAAPRPTGRSRRGALRFAMSKTDRKLDRVDRGHCELFHNVHMPLATTRRTHIRKSSHVFAFIIILCFRGVFEGARRDGSIRLAELDHFRGMKHKCLLRLPLSWYYAYCVCCASCAFRSGASESASGSHPTRSTRSAGANCLTPIIQPLIFVFWIFSWHPCTRVLCHTLALVPNGTQTCVFE